MQYQVKSFIPKLVVVIGVVGFLYGFYCSAYYNPNIKNLKINSVDENYSVDENDSVDENTNTDANTNSKHVNFNTNNNVEIFDVNTENTEINNDE